MRRNKKKNLMPLLVILLLGISLGYALLSQDLTILGTSKVKGNTWDIHFENVVINSNSVTLSTGDVAAAIDANDDTLVNYTVTLNVPGDFYEFTVDAVNDGTVDGMIGSITSKLNNVAISSTNQIPAYLDYSVTYEDGTAIAANHLLEAGDSETYKVRVEFKRDIEESDLPTTDQSNAFSFGVSYVQSDSTAIDVPHPTTPTVYTINIWDENHEEDTMIWIGQSIPVAITQYSSAAEAMAALNTLAGGTVARPIYLKHTVSNNIVTESYVEFVITQDLATANPGMTAGTYILQGEAMCEWDSVNYQPINCSEEDSQYYASNITTLQTAFGVSNCSSGTDSLGEYYSCSAGGLIAYAYSNGNVYVYYDYFDCSVGVDGTSYCDGVPNAGGGGSGGGDSSLQE